MSRVETTTNFRDNNGTDLGKKLVTKDYLISVYPEIGDKIGIPPELWIWGYEAQSLGNARTAFNVISTPITTFAGGTNWKQVSGGYNYMAAIKTDGTLWSWGSGSSGKLGNAVTTGTISTPVTTFAGGTNWKQVSAGNSQTAAIKTDGTLWIWGIRGGGRLGNAVSTTGNISTPITTFAGGNNWKQVSSGANHTAAIKTDGTLWIWGLGDRFQLGNAQITNRSTPVTTFAGGTNWKQVSCGYRHTAAIKTDGTLWTWGYQFQPGQQQGPGYAYSKLGTNDEINKSTPVTTFAGGTNWKQVSCGIEHTAAIKTDGTLWTWGYAYRGQIGNGINTNSYQSTPVTTFAGGTNWKQVNANQHNTAAIKTDGTLWSWGDGGFGALGNAQVSNRSTPVTTFAGGNNWKEVSCANRFIAAIQSVDFTGF